MELFVKVAFWMVTLCITVSGYPTAPPYPPLRKADFKIQLMREEVKCPSDSRFYVPENIEPKCITAALECILKELNGTVKEECDDPEERIEQALETLDCKLEQRSDYSLEYNIPSECACERWKEDLFDKFLEKYESLLDLEKSLEGENNFS